MFGYGPNNKRSLTLGCYYTPQRSPETYKIVLKSDYKFEEHYLSYLWKCVSVVVFREVNKVIIPLSDNVEESSFLHIQHNGQPFNYTSASSINIIKW